MYTKEEREGILWEFHDSGMSVAEACRRLPLFPTRANLYRWLRMEEAGELAATEMPDRAARMHCAHGEGSARFAARSRRVRGEAEVEGPEQTDWRDWGADLPEDPAERARMAEVKLAEALAVLDVLKAPGPASLTSMEKWRAGELARERCPLARLRDVTETLSIPKSTCLDQAARAARADPKAALRAGAGLLRGERGRLRRRVGDRGPAVGPRRGGLLARPRARGRVDARRRLREGRARDHGRGGPRSAQGRPDGAPGEVLELRRRALRAPGEPAARRGRPPRVDVQ